MNRQEAYSYSTQTTTTMPEPPQTNSTIRLQSNQIVVQKKITALLEQMRQSNLFSTQRMVQWEERFPQLNFNAEIPQARDDNAFQLVFFIFDVIRPAMISEQRTEKKKEVFAFEDEVKEILHLTLPPEVNPDLFVEKLEDIQDEEILLEEKLKMIQACFEEQIEELLRTADQIDQTNLIDQYNLLKDYLQKVNDNRQLLCEAIHIKIDALTEEVDKISKDLMKNTIQAENAGQRLLREERRLMALLTECQQLFKKVRV